MFSLKFLIFNSNNNNNNTHTNTNNSNNNNNNMRDQGGFSQGNYKSTFKQENQWRKKIQNIT